MDFFEQYKVKHRNDKEYYIVYDEQGKKIGEISCSAEKKLKDQYLKVVTCFVINEQGLVLIEQRSKKTKLNPGELDLVSGHVNGMETGRQAVVREIEEETGIRLAPDEIFNIRRVKSLPLTFESKGKKRNFFIEFCYLLTDFPMTQKQDDEVACLMWIPLETAFKKIKNGETKFPPQGENVNYDEIFDIIREAVLNRECKYRDIIEKKVLGE